ncbi:MAG: HD-GYP domain-containing protein [Methylobacterium sp.]|nr:HD-GYP domain-containing protein [Methylobacterium sp.]
MDTAPHFTTPDRLQVGMYIHLDISWMDHPFSFSNFMISDEQQLAQVRALGLKHIRYDPLRGTGPRTSDTGPEAETPATAHATAATEQPDRFEDGHQLRLRALHQAIHDCDQQFSLAVTEAKLIEREITSHPPKILPKAYALIDSMVDSLMSEGDIVLHAMQSKNGGAERFLHTLNVTVLALILAKVSDMSAEEARSVGMGSLLHDLGKHRIPDRITHNPDPLTRAEAALLEQHPAFGADFARENSLPENVLQIILQHHECFDGSGYPARLKQDQISPLARIVAVANTYDNLCNPFHPAEALSPYEALALMFARMPQKFDPELLKLLIKTLGVYPPGSVVQLSDGRYGLVASVNPSKPMRPFVVIYAPDVPREKPQIINLGEENGLAIQHCLRQNQMPRDVLTYLSPGKRICYFFHHDQLHPGDPG